MVAVNNFSANDDAKLLACTKAFALLESKRIERVMSAFQGDLRPKDADCFALAMSISAMFFALKIKGVKFNDA